MRRARAAAPLPALVLAAALCAPCPARAAGGLDLSVPPVRHGAQAPVGTPWTDPSGADHRARDAARRAGERPPAAAAPAPPPSGASVPPERSAGAIEPESPDALRRRGERERDARQGRGSTLPPPMTVPRIQPDPPPAVPVAPPPRIAIPAPGEPGGPPIVLPSCGPAGCFDANGRPMPRVGGTDVLIGPGGRPCIQVGGAASC